MVSNSLKNPGILWLRKSGNPELSFTQYMSNVMELMRIEKIVAMRENAYVTCYKMGEND